MTSRCCRSNANPAASAGEPLGGMRRGFWGFTVTEDSAIRFYVVALKRSPDADTPDTLRAVARLLDRSYVAVRHRAHELGVCDEES